MGKHTVNKQMINLLMVSDLPDIIKDVEERNSSNFASIEIYSDGSGEIKADSIHQDKSKTVKSFETLGELREFLLQEDYSNKNI